MSNLTNAYAADGLTAPMFFRRPPYHPFNPAEQGLVEAPFHVLALPLPKGRIGQLGPYPRGANGWRQWDPTCPFSDKFILCMHLLSFSMELDENNGTPVFLGAPGSAKVRKSQLAFFRRIEGKPRKGDEWLLRVGSDIKWDSTCDKNLSEVFCELQQGIHDSRIPGRQDREQNDGDNLADGVRYEMPDEDDGGGGGGRHRRGRGRGRRRRRNGEDDDDEEDEDESDDEETAEDAAIMGILNERLKDANGQSVEGRNIIEKVKIIVQQMTRPDPVNPGREEDAGCVIFFCVMDDLYSMGTPFQTLIKMGEEHRLFVSRQRKALPGRGRGQGAGGGGPGGRPPYNTEPSLTERFPFLKDPDHISNGLLNFTSETYLDLAAFITNDPEMVRENRQENMNNLNRLSHPGTESHPNRMHPALLFTPEWAMSIMRLYGVEPVQASLDTLRGGHGWRQRYIDDVLMNCAVERWFFAPERSYHILKAGFVWARLGYAGLESQYFPWFEIPEPLLKTTMTRSAGNALVRYDAKNGANKLAPDYAEAMIIPDLGRPEVLPVKFYDPNIISRRDGIRMVTLDNARMMATLTAPNDPLKEPKAYVMYCDMMSEYRYACMTNMMNALKPSNHIYPSMNAILLWMATEMRQVSVPLMHYTTDPYDAHPSTWPLDGFANYMIHTGLVLKNDLFLAARADRWILVHFSSSDCHSCIKVKMHPSAIVHGPAEGGKSHLFGSALTDTLIPDTVTPILECSEKAWYVHENSMGLIIRVDEAPAIWVDAKAAASDKTGAAERLKSMATEHKATYRTLVLIEGANGRSERRSETIESLYHATMWVCTNKMVSHSDEAIASRFFNFIMTGSECNLFELASLDEHLNDDDRNRKADAIHAWRIKQALISISLLLIDSQILPRPSMDVFDHIHTRVLAYFKEQGVNTNAIRKVDMVRRVATIYVVLNGLICLYDNPGAKYAGKEFEFFQLMDLVPYLYATKQITIFTMTQTEEVFLNPLRSAVLKGIMSQAKIPYVRGKTVEEYFKEDTGRTLAKSWKRDDNAERGVWYDFNYVGLGAPTLKDVYANIAESCEIKVTGNEVQGVLEGLSGNKAGYIRVKKLQQLREDFYLDLKESSIANYTGLTREDEVSSLPIVIRDYKHNMLYVATEAIHKLHDELLVEAMQACLYAKWQPQEILTAYEARKQNPVDPDKDQTYVGLFDVLRFTADVVEEFAFMESYTAPNVAYVTPLTQKMMSGPRRHPDKRSESYAPQREKRLHSTMSIDMDLDVWGHKQHHYRAGCKGRPEKSPSYPNTLRESVRRALQQNEDYHVENDTLQEVKHVNLLPRCLKMKYPNDLIDELDAHAVAKHNARPFTEITLAKQQAYDMEVQAWIAGGKVGTPPIMTTLSNTGRAVRMDYLTADLAHELGAANGLNRLTGTTPKATAAALAMARVSGTRLTLVNKVHDPSRAIVMDVTSYYTKKLARDARRLKEETARQQAREGRTTTTTGPSAAAASAEKRRKTTTINEYDDLPTTASLMPDFDGHQQQQPEPALSTVHSVPTPGYTLVDGRVVLAAGLRARQLPHATTANNTTTTDGFTSLSSSTSSSAVAPATTTRPSKKAPPQKKPKLASEVYDANSRAVLLQSASVGFESASRLLGEDDGDDSRSRLFYEHTPIVRNDDDMPTAGLLDDDDNALENMDGFDDDDMDMDEDMDDDGGGDDDDEGDE